MTPKIYVKIYYLLLIGTLLFQFPTNPAVAAGNSAVSANFWQESTILKGYEVKSCFPERKWWLQFNDPILADYIEQAVRENQDAKIALARIEEEKSLARAVMGQEFPQVTLYGLFARAKSSSNFLAPNVGNNAKGFLPPVLAGGTSNLYITPIIAQYEVDYLLKNHSKTKSAEKDMEAAQFDYQTVLISLTTELTTAYFNLIKSDKLLELNTELLCYLEKGLELRHSLFKEGDISYDDILINQKAISQTKSNISEIQKLQGLAVHQICILMGKTPLEQSCFPRGNFDNISFNKEIQIGTPCDLIAKRPDILSAETKLKKAGIDASVAYKDFFPTLSVTGIFAFASSDLDKLFDWKSNLDAIAAQAAQSLFTGGTKIANYKASKAKYKGALQVYQKTILTAFQEVEDSLRKLNSDFTQYNEAESQVLDSQGLLNLTNSRWQEGENSYLDIINNQQQLINDKQNKIQSKSNLLIDNISLYKALGGGF